MCTQPPLLYIPSADTESYGAWLLSGCTDVRCLQKGATVAQPLQMAACTCVVGDMADLECRQHLVIPLTAKGRGLLPTPMGALQVLRLSVGRAGPMLGRPGTLPPHPSDRRHSGCLRLLCRPHRAPGTRAANARAAQQGHRIGQPRMLVIDEDVPSFRQLQSTAPPADQHAQANKHLSATRNFFKCKTNYSAPAIITVQKAAVIRTRKTPEPS